jgi:hypothetical protein
MGMTRSITSFLFLLLLVTAPVDCFARGGLYFGLDLGGAKVSGDSNIALDLKSGMPWSGGLARQTWTDFGSGMATGIRLGYNFKGYGGLEFNLLAHGNWKSAGGSWEGIGHVGVLARISPIQFLTLAKNPKLKALKDRDWDVKVFGGFAPYVVSGYHLNADTGRGWEGYSVQWGFGGEYYVVPTVSFGLDLRFLHSSFDTYLQDWSPKEAFPLKSNEKALVIAPMFTMTFHLFDPHK